MERYIEQLLTDIAYATENISLPFAEVEVNLHDWLSDDEENKTAPIRDLEEWTGIRKEQLPPAEKLTDDQVIKLLDALKKCSMITTGHLYFKLKFRSEFNMLPFAIISTNRQK